jgi:uncharacterized protein with HEPN domain
MNSQLTTFLTEELEEEIKQRKEALEIKQARNSVKRLELFVQSMETDLFHAKEERDAAILHLQELLGKQP